MPDKYQEEIEELLRGMGEKTPRNNAKHQVNLPPDDAPIEQYQAPPRAPKSGQVKFWPSVSPGKLAVIGFILLFLGAFWARPLIWVALGFLVGAYVLFFVKPRSVSIDKRWRGQAMEEESTSWEKFRRWLKK